MSVFLSQAFQERFIDQLKCAPLQGCLLFEACKFRHGSTSAKGRLGKAFIEGP